MASVNRVIIIGNLGRDPEVRTFPSGDRVATVSIATTETWKDKQTGERREATEWHRVVFRGGLAGIVEQYLRKGSQVYVEGSIRSRKYSDAQGIEKSIMEIVVSDLTMLGAGQGGQPGQDDQGQGHRQNGGGQQGGGGRQGYAPAPPPRQPAGQQRTPPTAARAPAPAADGFSDMDDDIPW